MRSCVKQHPVINLLDYSCSVLPEYKYTDIDNWTIPITPDDIKPEVSYPYLGGKRRSKKRKHKSAKTKKIKKYFYHAFVEAKSIMKYNDKSKEKPTMRTNLRINTL